MQYHIGVYNNQKFTMRETLDGDEFDALDAEEFASRFQCSEEDVHIRASASERAGGLIQLSYLDRVLAYVNAHQKLCGEIPAVYRGGGILVDIRQLTRSSAFAAANDQEHYDLTQDCHELELVESVFRIER